MEREISKLSQTDKKPSLLLHACCAPCSSSVLERVVPYFTVTLFYYNPNIWPLDEFEKRAAEFPKLLSALEIDKDVSLIIPPYDEKAYYDAVSGLECEPEGGERCTKCFDVRLRKTAQTAGENGFDYFCTTLSVSPHKDAERINEIGISLEKAYGIKWLPADFKKKNGYLRSVELCEKFGIYRQNYCGCKFAACV